MKLTDSLKPLFIDTAELTGAARRLFMAKVVKPATPALRRLF